MSIENIAYCGLFCADCPNRKGIIADLAFNHGVEWFFVNFGDVLT